MVEAFGTLEQEQLLSFADHWIEHRYDRSTVLFQAGDHDHRLYVVAEGEIEIIADGTVVNRQQPGDLFGEVAALGDLQRTASAIAATNCVCLSIERSAFLQHVQDNAAVSIALNRALSRRLSEALAREVERTAKLHRAYRELEQAQISLVHSEKMASLGSLTAGIMHELNNPMGMILSAQDTLDRSLTKLIALPKEELQSKKAERFFRVLKESGGVIRSGGARVVEVLQRLKRFAKMDEADVEQVDLADELQDTIGLLSFPEDVEVVTEFNKVPPVRCRARDINQVFLNVLKNALQAVPEGKIHVTLNTADEFVVIRIEDTGPGIPEEILGRVFDPGFTTKGVKVGTGLGLSISDRIVRDHGGSLDVKNRLDRSGVSVVIRIPIQGTEAMS